MRRATLPVGARFGRLVVDGPVTSVRSKAWVNCRCDCGATKLVRVEALRRRGQQSCGCLRNELTAARGRAMRTHGEATALTPEYSAWRSMIRRCTAANGPKWAHYGGRGIRVCEQWRSSFETFLADVGRRSGKGFSLDRIDVNGHYEPGNVRWADAITQRHNRRDSEAA